MTVPPRRPGEAAPARVRAEPTEQSLHQAARRLLWTLSVPVFALLGVLTVAQYRQGVHEFEQNLLARLDQRALELAQLARPATDHVHDLRELMLQRWHEPPDSGPALGLALGPRQHGTAADGWTLDAAPGSVRARYGQVWWAQSDGRAPPAIWLHRAAAFVQHARVAHQRTPGFEATWFAAVGANTSFGYPWISTDRIVQAMGTPGLTAMAPVREQASASSRQWLERHAPRTTWWGAPDVSQLHGQLVVSHGAMLLVDGVFVGEISVDFRLDALQQRVQSWAGGAPEHWWIVGDERHVLADAVSPLLPPAGQSWAPGRSRQALRSGLADHLPAELPVVLAQQALRAPGRLLRDAGWLAAAGHHPDSPWSTLAAMPLSAVRTEVLAGLAPNALLAAALVAAFLAGQWRVSRRFRAIRHLEDRREAFTAAIVDGALAAIVATDANGRIVEFNRAAESMFGRRRDEVIGQSAGLLFAAGVRDGYVANLHKLETGKQERFLGEHIELIGLRSDGREFPVELVLWRTEHDGEVHFSASMVDLSERQQAQHEIERQREALRQSEKLSAMGGLLAGVAHELNNPLAVVMGRAGLLEEKLQDAQLRGDATRIREAAERCGRIVRTFLNMARSKAPQHRPVQLNELVRAAVDMLGYTFRSHGVEAVLELAPGLPHVQADGDQIGQIVLNLLVNAQQALAAVDPPRRVWITTGVEAPRPHRPARVWLRVRDNGPGVPQTARERLFDPFFTTKSEGMGTGLGLSVSRSIAQAHGGDLQLEAPTARGGACFRMSLPLAAPAEPPAPTIGTQLAEEAPALARVLVVDDEPEIAQLMRDMLESAGYEVATAESGAVALELLDMARIDAVVSDLRMPDMDGAALWREVRERQPELARRMLFVTGDTLSPGARQFLDQTGCDSLDKPFARADLLARVARTLAAGAANPTADANGPRN
jgi:two-component system NtrC family sensor kinase